MLSHTLPALESHMVFVLAYQKLHARIRCVNPKNPSNNAPVHTHLLSIALPPLQSINALA